MEDCWWRGNIEDGGTPPFDAGDDEICDILCRLLLGRECDRGRDFERDRERVRDPALLVGRDNVVACTLLLGMPPFT